MTLAEAFEAYARRVSPKDGSALSPSARATLERTFYIGAAAYAKARDEDPAGVDAELLAFADRDELARRGPVV